MRLTMNSLLLIKQRKPLHVHSQKGQNGARLEKHGVKSMLSEKMVFSYVCILKWRRNYLQGLNTTDNNHGPHKLPKGET